MARGTGLFEDDRAETRSSGIRPAKTDYAPGIDDADILSVNGELDPGLKKSKFGERGSLKRRIITVVSSLVVVIIPLLFVLEKGRVYHLKIATASKSSISKVVRCKGVVGADQAILDALPLSDNDALIDLPLPPSEANEVHVGESVLIKAPKRHTFRGTVLELFPESSTLIHVVAAVPDTNGELQDGQSVSAEIVLYSNPIATFVPTKAIMNDTAVWRVDANSRVRYTSVRTGLTRDDSTEIVAGIGPGAMVVLNPPKELHDDDMVKQR